MGIFMTEKELRGLQDLSNKFDEKSIKKIGNEVVYAGKIGAFTDENSILRHQAHCLNAIIEQNYIIIRQLNKISKQLEKIENYK